MYHPDFELLDLDENLIAIVIDKNNNNFIFNFFYNMSIKMMKSMIRLLSFGQIMQE